MTLRSYIKTTISTTVPVLDVEMRFEKTLKICMKLEIKRNLLLYIPNEFIFRF